MSYLSYGCNSCSTLDSFDGSLQGSFNNNADVNHLLASQQNQMNNEMPSPPPSMQPPVITNHNNNINPPTVNLNQIKVPQIPSNNNVSNNNIMNNQNNQMMNNTQAMNNNQMVNNNVTAQNPNMVNNTNNKVRNNNPMVVNANLNVEEEDNVKLMWQCCLKLGLVIVCSLAFHETVKYYINHSIKFNDGSATYYIYYTILMLALTGLVCFFLVKK